MATHRRRAPNRRRAGSQITSDFSRVKPARPTKADVLAAAGRTAFGRRRAGFGRQPERLRDAGLWVLPNPSGLNANHQLPELARAFGALRKAARRTY